MDLPDKFRVKLRPNKAQETIQAEKNGWYKISVKEPATDGKANKALLDLLKDKTGKRYIIKHGKTSKKKLVERF
jgi:uncharacterized protein YggU (UPF0235/DUF167 family)